MIHKFLPVNGKSRKNYTLKSYSIIWNSDINSTPFLSQLYLVSLLKAVKGSSSCHFVYGQRPPFPHNKPLNGIDSHVTLAV